MTLLVTLSQSSVIYYTQAYSPSGHTGDRYSCTSLFSCSATNTEDRIRATPEILQFMQQRDTFPADELDTR